MDNNLFNNVSETLDSSRKGPAVDGVSTFSESESFITNKKRALTLAAIDGIGNIGVLKAPLINPQNPQIEPPILQLPSKTNLIKNVHVKVEEEINIDKSYKYRKQNSICDIISNMKPLYSLPERVMAEYINFEKEKAEKEKGEEETEVTQKNENDVKEDDISSEKIEHQNDENKDSLVEDVNIMECQTHETFLGNEKKKTIPTSKQMQNQMEGKQNTKYDNRELTQKEREIITADTEMKYETLKNCKKATNDSVKHENKDHIKNKKGSMYMSLKRDENDEFENFKSNKIMSSTLTNALRFLAGDIC